MIFQKKIVFLPSCQRDFARLLNHLKELIAKIWNPFDKIELLSLFIPAYFLIKFKIRLSMHTLVKFSQQFG